MLPHVLIVRAEELSQGSSCLMIGLESFKEIDHILISGTIQNEVKRLFDENRVLSGAHAMPVSVQYAFIIGVGGSMATHIAAMAAVGV